MAAQAGKARRSGVGPARPHRPGSERWGRWLPLAAILGLGTLLGLGVVVAGPLLALMAVGAILVVGLAVVYPEVVIVLVLAMASDLLPSRVNPFFSLPFGSLQASDLILLLLLGIVVVRVVVEPHFHLVRTPLDVPLLLFYGAVLLGLGVAVLGFGINFSDATYEARMLAYYLLFFAITNLVRTRAQMRRMAVGLVIVGLLLAILMLLTAAMGSMPGYTSSWALKEQGVARVFHPGFTVVYVTLMAVLTYSALRPQGLPAAMGHRGLRWLLVAILALGLLSTLARNVIVAGGVSFLIILALLRRSERSRLLQNLVLIAVLSAIVLLGLLVLGEAGPLLKYGDLYLARIERMFSPAIVAQGENLQPRWTEIRYAWAKLQAHPLLGIGLYNAYRPPFYEGEPVTLQHFLHNAYLSLWLKTGLPGLLAFLWLSALFVTRGLRQWARAQDRLLQAVVLGSAAAFVGLLLSNLVAPSFVQPGSLAVFGFILGFNEAVFASEAAAASEATAASGAISAGIETS